LYEPPGGKDSVKEDPPSGHCLLLLAAITLSSQRGKGSHFCLYFNFKFNFKAKAVMMAGSHKSKGNKTTLL